MKPVIRIGRAFLPDIKHYRHSKKLLRRDLVDRRLSWRKMNWRIQMRPVMLQHPEAAREIPILLNSRIDFGLEPLQIARPRYQTVVDGIREIHHSRLPGKDSLEHAVRGAGCRVRPQFQPCAEFLGTRPR